jgi:hypothetical protein
VVGLGLPRHTAGVGPDHWPVALRCHSCGHDWSLTRQAIEVAGDPSPRTWTLTTVTRVQPITACRHCAGLIALDVAIDRRRPPQSSGYACPHCGAAGQVTLPGADVRTVEAVATVRPITAIAS